MKTASLSGKNNKTVVTPQAGNTLEERPKIKISTPPPISMPPMAATTEKSRTPESAKPPALSVNSNSDTTADLESSATAERDQRSYTLPSLNLLTDPQVPANLSKKYFEDMSQTLENALGQFGVAAKVVEVCPGPVVTGCFDSWTVMGFCTGSFVMSWVVGT